MSIKLAVAVLILSILLLNVCLSSCGGSENSPDVTDEGQLTEAVPTELVIASGGQCFYTVVRSDVSDQIETKAAVKLCNAIEDVTGVRPTITTDWEDNPVVECEIVVGVTTREQTENHAIDRVPLGVNGYVIETDGERIYIAGGSSEATATAVDKFIKGFVNDATITLQAGYNDSLYQQFDMTLTISGVPLSEYTIVSDDNRDCMKASDSLAQKLWEKTGVLPDIQTGSPSDYPHSIYVTNTVKPSKGGIHLVENKDGSLIVSTSASAGISACVDRFAAKYINGSFGSYNIPDGFLYVASGDYLIVVDPHNA